MEMVIIRGHRPLRVEVRRVATAATLVVHPRQVDFVWRNLMMEIAKALDDLKAPSKRLQSAWEQRLCWGAGPRLVRFSTHKLHFILGGRRLNDALVLKLEPCSRGHPGHEARPATT